MRAKMLILDARITGSEADTLPRRALGEQNHGRGQQFPTPAHPHRRARTRGLDNGYQRNRLRFSAPHTVTSCPVSFCGTCLQTAPPHSPFRALCSAHSTCLSRSAGTPSRNGLPHPFPGTTVHTALRGPTSTSLFCKPQQASKQKVCGQSAPGRDRTPLLATRTGTWRQAKGLGLTAHLHAAKVRQEGPSTQEFQENF